MDINRVELKGRMGSDITYRKTKNNDEWASFTVVCNEYNKTASIEKDKSTATWISVAVFNPLLVNKTKNLGLRQGQTVWLIGKIYVNKVEYGGHMHPYVSIVATELEVCKTKKKENEFDIKPQQIDQPDF